MRKALFLLVGVGVGVAAMVACGGNEPTPVAPTENTAPGSIPSASPPVVGDVDAAAPK